MTIDITPEAVERHISRTNAACEVFKNSTNGHILTLVNRARKSIEVMRALSAALERSQAETAAAYEAAAREIDCGGCNGDCPMPHTCCAYDASAIRALTPADIKAALDRMIAAARADGMREAAAIANTLSDFIPAVILAAIPKGKDHE